MATVTPLPPTAHRFALVRPVRRPEPAPPSRSASAPGPAPTPPLGGAPAWRPRPGHRPAVAATAREHRPTYDATPTTPVARGPDRTAHRPSSSEPERPPHPVDDPAWRYVHDLDAPTTDEEGPPFGLPVLAEIPALGTVLAQLRDADRLIARALEGVLLLQEHADVVAMTGVGLESWLTTIARRTRTDARMLLTAAEMLRRLPSLRAAFQTGQVSWAQVRTVALKARPLPRHLDDRVDAAVAAALDGAGGAEPDALTRVIGWTLAELHPERSERAERTEAEREFLAMQPRIDGTGGRLWGELSAASWAVVDAALHPPTGTTATAATTDGEAGPRRSPGLDGARTDPGTSGRERARRLVSLLESTLPGAAVSSGASSGSRPQLLLRADLDTLLARGSTPASLLTTLLGGHVRVSSATAQRLLDERGSDLRTIVIDDTGSVVGVGRRHRVAPGWLSDAILALHDTCSAPGCQRAARGADLDHAQPWWPARAQDLPGNTDVRQLAPLCGTHNRAKEREGWRVEQTPNGRRRWIHERSGLTTETLPATWQPRPDPEATDGGGTSTPGRANAPP